MVGILSLHVCFLFVCTITDFSVAEKVSGVKLRMLVRLLSGMSSNFGELWPRGGSPRSLNTRRGGLFLGLRWAKIASKSRVAE